MNYANLIGENHQNLKHAFIVATLISTIAGTFTTGINLFDRVHDKAKQAKKDTGQDEKIKDLERRLNEQEKDRKDNQRREDRLEQSLVRGAPMVQREYDYGFDRMGPRFARGDQTTQNQLQGQVIMLQGTVIKLLENAMYTGQFDDVNKLYNASEFAREGTVRALRDQYQRMAVEAPLRRPVGPVRRISSTPALNGNSHAVVIRADRGGTSRRGGDERSQRSKPTRIREERVDNQSTTSSTRQSVAKATSASNMPPILGGALFCSYALDLQHSHDVALDGKTFGKSGNQACPTCGTKIVIEEGRVWRIDKTIKRETLHKEEFDEDIYEQRTYLVENRFIVKCHREGSGFACALCSRNRDFDTVTGDASGLVKHLWKKHEVEELEEEEDIVELSVYEKRVKRY